MRLSKPLQRYATFQEYIQGQIWSECWGGSSLLYTATISGLTVQGLILNVQAIAQMRYVKPCQGEGASTPRLSGKITCINADL
ncbi:hypothetical protein ALO54_200136 [Pseudomonas syringae pv. philadelphi]|nr:hypothetical protein ALO54_200136 [Pseudomonas syringae pv. philadelphi]RMM30600.1 hypothetical protein ALQ83_200217 [Pseudomonas syringae pv. berberidis]